MNFMERLKALAKRREMEGIYTDVSLINEAIDRLGKAGAEIEKLKSMLAGYGKLDADMAVAERRAVIAEAGFNEARKALEPFARAWDLVLQERPDAPDAISFAVMVDEHDDTVIGLTWGDLRAASRALTGGNNG